MPSASAPVRKQPISPNLRPLPRLLRGPGYVTAAALVAAVLLSAAAPRTFEAGTRSTIAVTEETPVADAAMRGDTTLLRTLLKQGVDANAAQADGMTALHWAATRGSAGEIKVLVYAGARLESTTRNGNYTPLHLAARSGQSAAVRALLESGANPNAVTSSGGATPLHMAAAEGDSASVKALIDHKANVDARETAYDQTPLMWAATYDRVAAIQTLVDGGADIEAVSKVEDMAAREKEDRASNSLRNRKVAALKAAENAPVGPSAGSPRGAGAAAGAKPGDAKANAGKDGDAKSGEANAVAANTTVKNDKKTEKKSEKKADKKEEQKVRDTDAAKTVTVPMDPPTAANDSALAAAAPKPLATVQGSGLLVGGTQPAQGGARGSARGAGLSYGDLVGKKGGLTPLLFAVRQGNTASVKILLKDGAKVNHVSDGDHTSPLLMATINGQFDIAKMLLTEHKADPKLVSDAGATPLYTTINAQWAAKSLYPQPTAQYQQTTSYLELMEDLLKAGADVNARLTKHLWYMSYNFDLLGVNTTGATAFWRAAYGTDVDAMKLLVKYGADPNIPTMKPMGQQRDPDGVLEDEGNGKTDPSGLPLVPDGGPGVFPLQAATGVGYGEGFAANAHRHAPEAWVSSAKYLIEELHLDVNSRDYKGYNALHDAAARGDTVLAAYLISKGGDITAVSRTGQTVADMANGPVQRVPPFYEAVVWFEKAGSKNSNKCKSC